MYLVKTSMTDIADKNNKWASYAGPGGWNGNCVNYDYKLTTIFHVSKILKVGIIYCCGISVFLRPRYAGGREWWHDLC